MRTAATPTPPAAMAASASEQLAAAAPHLRRVALLGLGLMGSSLGLALRASSSAASVVGYDAAAGVGRRARARGAIEHACASPARAVTGADVVVLAAPIQATRALLAAIAPHLAATAIVTDLGSTKTLVAQWARELLPDPSHFIGGHPMAGRERSGVAAADATLFAGCVWCLARAPDTAPAAAKLLDGLIARLGARPLWLTPEAHDEAVAWISHLPIVAASALTLAAGDAAAWPLARRLAAGGFRDTTRVAGGDPTMARDICLTNTAPLLASLDAYITRLHALRERIAARDAGIATDFALAQARRVAWAEGIPADGI